MITFHPLTLPHEWQWMKERTHVIACEDSQGIVAYRDGRVVAVVVADSFTVDGCSVHFAIDDSLAIRAGLFTEVADHLFRTCNRQRLFGLVPSNNEKALKLDRKIGFTEIARIPNAVAEGVDYIVMVMEKEDCRWLTPIKEAA